MEYEYDLRLFHDAQKYSCGLEKRLRLSCSGIQDTTPKSSVQNP
jgi:hypothetical protein